jgi:hypothetical protein
MSGCGPGGPRVYKAGGTVTYNNKPVEGAQVTFGYADGNFANGVTDAAGKFQLVYMGNPGGAPPGKCDVGISKISAPSITAPTTTDPSKMMEAMKEFQKAKDKAPPKSEIPLKYANPAASGLKYEITTDEKANNFTIDLKD